ncbi:hypothetical protein [Methanoculleus sp.]
MPQVTIGAPIDRIELGNDRQVYELYGLTEDEVKMVEGGNA